MYREQEDSHLGCPGHSGTTQLLCPPRALPLRLLCGSHNPPWLWWGNRRWVYLRLPCFISKLYFGIITKPYFPQAFSFISQIHWKDWYWSWNSNTLATWCEELIHWKRSWCWERLKAGGDGNDRGWDSWMASLTQWTWVSVNSGSWWWTGRPGVLQSMGSKRVGCNWVTELFLK